MSYQNYAGAWLTQTNGSYLWLADPWQPVVTTPGADTAKIWQSFSLPGGSPINNLIVWGDGNYAAGNAQDNVLIAQAPRDLLYGGLGQDVLVGSGGSGTTFIIAAGEGNKVVQNFAEGADTLRLIGGPLTSFDAVRAAMTQQGADVVLNDGGTMILFRGANVAQFQARDFQLPLDRAALGTPTFSEEFDNPGTIGANWATNYGYAGDGLNSFTLSQNGEQQIYVSPSFHGTAAAPLGLNPYIFNNGVLSLTARPVSDATASQMWGYHYASGMIESNVSQTYGYFEMRAELPKGQGLWPAFWLLGEQNKEIDVLEGLGSDTKTAYNALHSPTVPALGNASFNPYADGFHTYGVLWTKETLTYYVDGTPVWKTATPYEMNGPMHMIVNLAVGGNWPGSPDASTPWPAEFKVDYVRAYNVPGVTAPTPTTPAPTPTPDPQPSPSPSPSPSDAGKVLTSTTYGASLVGAGGNDTLIAGQGPDHLTGGGGADSFVFKALPWNAGHITDFQVGVDKLVLSSLYTNGYSGADPVADGYLTFASNGAGGTAVYLDPDGPAGGNTIRYLITTLDGVAPGGLTAANVLGGGAGGSSPPASPQPPATGGVVLTSTTYGATLVGGAGTDTLIAGQGPDRLTGGAGADHFQFDRAVWNPGHITDFQTGGDVIDLRGLFAAAGYHGGDPVADGYLRFVPDGAGGTQLLFDEDGWGSAHPWPTTITTLDGVAPGAVTSANWLFH